MPKLAEVKRATVLGEYFAVSWQRRLVSRPEQGLASGLLNTSFQLGGAVGLAIVTAVVTSQTGTGTGPQAVIDGFRPGTAVATGIGLFGLLVSLAGVVSERRARVAAIEPDVDADDHLAQNEFALTGQEMSATLGADPRHPLATHSRKEPSRCLVATAG